MKITDLVGRNDDKIKKYLIKHFKLYDCKEYFLRFENENHIYLTNDLGAQIFLSEFKGNYENPFPIETKIKLFPKNWPEIIFTNDFAYKRWYKNILLINISNFYIPSKKGEPGTTDITIKELLEIFNKKWSNDIIINDSFFNYTLRDRYYLYSILGVTQEYLDEIKIFRQNSLTIPNPITQNL